MKPQFWIIGLDTFKNCVDTFLTFFPSCLPFFYFLFWFPLRRHGLYEMGLTNACMYMCMYVCMCVGVTCPKNNRISHNALYILQFRLGLLYFCWWHNKRQFCLCRVLITLIIVYLLCARKLWRNNALTLQFWCLSNFSHPSDSCILGIKISAHVHWICLFSLAKRNRGRVFV